MKASASKGISESELLLVTGQMTFIYQEWHSFNRIKYVLANLWKKNPLNHYNMQRLFMNPIILLFHPNNYKQNLESLVIN